MRYPPGMDHDDTNSRPIPAGWLEAMDESDVDLAAGRIVSAGAVHAELRASIARLGAAQLDADRVGPPQQASGHGATSNRP